MERELNGPWWALRLAYGIVPIVAGVDKFFNLLTNWEQYLSPMLKGVVPATTFMHVVGIIEIVAGLIVLSKWTRWGGYIVMAWLIGIVLNLLSTGKYFDIAARDAVMACGAFTLAKMAEVRARVGVTRRAVVTTPATTTTTRPAGATV